MAMVLRLMLICISIFYMAFSSVSYGASQIFFGSPGDEDPRSPVVVVSDGFVFGGFISELATGDSEGSYFKYKAAIYKLNSDLTKEWEYIGGEGSHKLHYVIATSDGGVVGVGSKSTSYKGTDGWIIKLSANDGNVLWEKSYGGIANDQFTSVVETSNGFLVVGNTDSYGSGNTDVWVLALTHTGELLWHKTIGQRGGDFAMSLAKVEGGYVIAGTSLSYDPLDFQRDLLIILISENGDVINKTVYLGGYQDYTAFATPTSDGGVLIAGFSDSFTFSSWDGILLKFDKQVQKQWSRVYFNNKESQREYIRHAVEESPTFGSNYFVVGGRLSYDANLKTIIWQPLVAKLNSSGEILWLKAYKPPMPYTTSLGRYLVKIPGGYLVLSKSYNSSSKKMDNWLFKIDGNGNPLDNSITVTDLTFDFSHLPINFKTIDPALTSKVLATKSYKETLQNGKLHIKKGWNLVGSLRPEHKYIDQFKEKLIQTIWCWNALKSSWSVRVLSVPDEVSKQYAASKGFEHLDVIEPGKGFWINAAEDFELE